MLLGLLLKFLIGTSSLKNKDKKKELYKIKLFFFRILIYYSAQTAIGIKPGASPVPVLNITSPLGPVIDISISPQ